MQSRFKNSGFNIPIVWWIGLCVIYVLEQNMLFSPQTLIHFKTAILKSYKIAEETRHRELAVLVTNCRNDWDVFPPSPQTNNFGCPKPIFKEGPLDGPIYIQFFVTLLQSISLLQVVCVLSVTSLCPVLRKYCLSEIILSNGMLKHSADQFNFNEKKQS